MPNKFRSGKRFQRKSNQINKKINKKQDGKIGEFMIHLLSCRAHEKKYEKVMFELRTRYWKKCIDEWTMGGDNEIGREMDRQIALRNEQRGGGASWSIGAGARE